MAQRLRRFFKSLPLACALFGCLPHAPAALGRQEATRQEETRQEETGAPDDAEGIVRIDAELIQTGVMVFDKQGRFVEGRVRAAPELRGEVRS